MWEFRLKFHWSLFRKFQSTIFQHWLEHVRIMAWRRRPGDKPLSKPMVFSLLTHTCICVTRLQWIKKCLYVCIHGILSTAPIVVLIPFEYLHLSYGFWNLVQKLIFLIISCLLFARQQLTDQIEKINFMMLSSINSFANVFPNPKPSWWRHQMETFSAYWPFVRGIHRSSDEFPAQRPVTRTLLFSLICAWINGWVNNSEAGDLRRHRAHNDVTVVLNPTDQIYLVDNENSQDGN